MTIAFVQSTESKIQQNLLKQAEELAETFRERSAEIDAQGKFPFENFEDLKQKGFLALTVPIE